MSDFRMVTLLPQQHGPDKGQVGAKSSHRSAAIKEPVTNLAALSTTTELQTGLPTNLANACRAQRFELS